jgi:hypothetical protein
MFRRNGSSIARGHAGGSVGGSCFLLFVSRCRKGPYLDGQGSLSHTSVSQHHQLIQRHFPRHDHGKSDGSARSVHERESSDIPIILEGRKEGKVRSARRGKGEVAHVPGGGAKKKSGSFHAIHDNPQLFR